MSILNGLTYFDFYITVQQSQDSSVSCDVMCEFKDIKPISRLNVINTGNISITIDPYGSINCTVNHTFDGYSTVNSTHEPSITSNKTTGGCLPYLSLRCL